MFIERVLTIILLNPVRGLSLGPISSLEVGFFVGIKPIVTTRVTLNRER